MKADEKLPVFKVSLGIGSPNLVRYTTFFNVYKGQPGYETKSLGPFHLKLEYRLKWWLGLGINVNYMSYGLSYIDRAFDPNVGAVDNKVRIRNTNTAVNLRSNFYFFNPEKRTTKSELYLGAGLGYKFGKFKVTSEYEEYTPKVTFNDLYKFGFEATCGYRYNFSKHLAVYSEIGVAKSIFQLGLTGRF